MRILTLLLTIVTAVGCFEAVGADSNGTADDMLKPLIEKRVVVEGLAWGAMAKGLGERVVLPSGTSLYFTGSKYRDQHKNGRTVRVIGRLKVQVMKPAPDGAQGYTERFEYYGLEVESIQVIDEVRQERPELVKK